jgi:hypothetical protein
VVEEEERQDDVTTLVVGYEEMAMEEEMREAKRILRERIVMGVEMEEFKDVLIREGEGGVE